MANLQRPVKRGGNRKYAEEYAVGNHYAQDTEIDADFDTIYRAWNTEVPPTMRDTIVPPNSITNAMIQDGAVNDVKISDVAWAKITDAPTALPPSGPAGGDLEGSTYPDPMVKPLAITKQKLSADVAAGLAPIYTAADGNKVLAVNPAGTALTFVAAPPATLTPGQVTTTYIADSPNGVTDSKITSVAWTKVTGAPTSFPPTGAAGGDLAGSTYPAPVIAPGKITDAKINDVSATKLTGTIPAARFPTAPSGLSNANINDGAVNNAKISDVAYAKVTGAPAIPTSLPPSGPAGGSLALFYPNPMIAANAVTTDMIAPGAVIGSSRIFLGIFNSFSYATAPPNGTYWVWKTITTGGGSLTVEANQMVFIVGNAMMGLACINGADNGVGIRVAREPGNVEVRAWGTEIKFGSVSQEVFPIQFLVVDVPGAGTFTYHVDVLMKQGIGNLVTSDWPGYITVFKLS